MSAGTGPEVQGFAPVARADARVLVLGSAPSVLSLRRGEYFGHPRNLFWPVMAELLGRPAGEGYAARTQMLLEARIAVWDVLARAQRPGSLDASIVTASAQPNDFTGFFAEHPEVHAVFFNGRTARTFWDRRVAGSQDLPDGLALTTLPSTSPAHAALSRMEKTEIWRQVVAVAAGAERGRGRGRDGEDPAPVPHEPPRPSPAT